MVAAQAASRGGRVSAADVCAAAVAAVGVTGAWLSAASGAEAGHLMRVTDEVSEQLAELQLALGEGPSVDASASGGPVLASDLGEMEAAGRWPAFAPAARQAGAGAIFAFPLRIDLSRTRPLRPAQMARHPPRARTRLTGRGWRCSRLQDWRSLSARGVA